MQHQGRSQAALAGPQQVQLAAYDTLAVGVATKPQSVRSLHFLVAVAALVAQEAQGSMVSMGMVTSVIRAAQAAQAQAERAGYSKPTFRRWEPTAGTALKFPVLGLAVAAAAVGSGQTTPLEPM